MNKQQTAQELLELLRNTQPLYTKAQATMLAARAQSEQAELYLKETKVRLTGQADGKNAEQREAWVYAQPEYKLAAADAADTRNEFNRAYALYKEQESTLTYIRDMSALLREIA